MKLLVDEPGSATAEAAWRAADARICCSIGLTAAAAAVSQAERMRRIDVVTAHAILIDLDHIWTGVSRVACDDELAAEAAQLAVLLRLRGYDAVHLASARSAGATLVAATGALLEAATACGLATIDVAA